MSASMGDTYTTMSEEKVDGGLSPSEYTVGWICALRSEMKAARSMLDSEHPTLELQSQQDGNNYLLGRIGQHNIAITSLPQAGTSRAATASKSMQTTFPNIRFCLLVGVGGGVPKSVFSWNDIRLGDIVVSEPTDRHGGVIQYDMGRRERDGFHCLGTLNNPPPLLLAAKNTLSTTKNLSKAIAELVNESFGDEEDPDEEWTYPIKAKDVLLNTDHPRTTKSLVLIVSSGTVLFASTKFFQFRQGYPGEGWTSLLPALWISCALCILSSMRMASTWYLKPKEVIRTQRRTTDPKIHYGNIGSGNSVVKNSLERDEIARRDNVICFEMEAAGIMNDFPCLVIRGISDYADAHKNWEWQPYAAAVAAAYAKKLLLTISPMGVKEMELMRQVTEGIVKIQKQTQELVHDRRSQHNDMILEWLSPVDHNNKHHDVISQRQSGTGQWFLDSMKFQDWQKATKSKALFCPGIPGAGKTFLSAIVIQHLQEQSRSNPDIGIAFIYCDFNLHSEQSAAHLIASLLKQLGRLRPHVLSNLYEDHQRKKTKPSYEEMLITLKSVAASYQQVFFVIDALDECRNASIRSKLLELPSKLGSEVVAKILMTSRHNTEIRNHFRANAILEIKASEGDIERYLNGRTKDLPAFVVRDKRLLEQIKVKIIQQVEGMFLLARFHMDSLVGQVTKNQIIETLTTLPTGIQAYDEVYKQCMKRVEGQIDNRKKLAKKLLAWITWAERPLTKSELEHALAVKVGNPDLSVDDIPQEMVELCAGLVKIDRKGGTIRLVHYTTREYFQREHERWFPNAQADITLTCLTYLALDSFQSGPCRTKAELEARTRSNPLYSYAARYWGRHARHGRPARGIEDIAVRFFKDLEKTDASSQVLFEDERVNGVYQPPRPRHVTGLHLIAYFGLHHLVDLLLRAGCALNAIDSERRTPLSVAIIEGHDIVVEELLKHADIEANIQDLSGRTPLMLAATKGHMAMTEGLLDHQADWAAQDQMGRTALHMAVRQGRDEVVTLLTNEQYAGDLDIRDKSGFTALHYAGLKFLSK